jgi:hypothetical protein
MLVSDLRTQDSLLHIGDRDVNYYFLCYLMMLLQLEELHSAYWDGKFFMNGVKRSEVIMTYLKIFFPGFTWTHKGISQYRQYSG